MGKLKISGQPPCGINIGHQILAYYSCYLQAFWSFWGNARLRIWIHPPVAPETPGVHLILSVLASSCMFQQCCVILFCVGILIRDLY